MDPSDQVTQQYLLAVVAVAVGVSGWVMPPKWNLLKLKARYAKSVSEATNLKIARAVGTMLIVAGVLIAVVTYQVGALK